MSERREWSLVGLEALKAENNKVTYDGKEYDGCQKTQMQRRLERTIRKQKELVNAHKAAGLIEDAQTAQIRLNRLNAKYKEFSKAAGLPEQRERMKVTYTDDKSVAAAERLKVQRAAEAETDETELVSDMTYQEWAGWKEKEQKTVANAAVGGMIDVVQMEWDELIDPDVDEYHEIMKILSEELRFEYVRKKN